MNTNTNDQRRRSVVYSIKLSISMICLDESNRIDPYSRWGSIMMYKFIVSRCLDCTVVAKAFKPAFRFTVSIYLGRVFKRSRNRCHHNTSSSIINIHVRIRCISLCMHHPYCTSALIYSNESSDIVCNVSNGTDDTCCERWTFIIDTQSWGLTMPYPEPSRPA
jgi:hypothetical protein